MIKLYFPEIDLKDTFECGQCFRWDNSGNSWCAVVEGEYVEVHKKDGYLIINSTKTEQFWKEYFDYDYKFDANAATKFAKAAGGIRILKQNPWETLVSFIISQNNNIPRIKGIISRLCENFGDPIKSQYAFPTPQQLIGQDLAPLRAGFRDKYILSAAEKCNSTFLEDIAKLTTNELRVELMKIKGVGKKIADCVMLFAYHRLEVFPQDVWIIRIMKEQFGIESNEIDDFAQANFGSNAGYIQQYLYHYFRNKARR